MLILLLTLLCAATAQADSGIVLRSSRPSETLDVIDIRRMTKEDKLLTVSVQGLVNRTRPSIYVLANPSDGFWLDVLKQRGLVRETTVINSAVELAKRHKSALKGAVIPDPKLAATVNIATMISGVREFAICTPEQARATGIPVKSDLRGRWSSSRESYEWAFKNIHNHLSRSAVAWACPTENFFAQRDYFIQHKIWTVWISGKAEHGRLGADIGAEHRFVEKLLASLPVNIPIFGFPYNGEEIGIGEMGGTAIASAYAKYNVATALSSNLSVHSGYPAPAVKHKKLPARRFDPSKVYVCFVVSDGDNLQALQEWKVTLWRDPARGSLPIAWTMGPFTRLLMPEIARYYFSSASPDDRFVVPCGAGYIYPGIYGSRFDRPGIHAAYVRLSAGLAREMDMSVLFTHDYLGTWEPHYREIAENWPDLKAVFADYTRRSGMTYDASRYGVPRGKGKPVPVIHAMTSFPAKTDRESVVASLVRDIREASATRPAFLNCFVINWFTTPSMLSEVMKQLGPDYVAVPPETLLQFASRYTREAVPIENLALTAAVSSPDGWGPELGPTLTDIENDRFACDGNPDTYWDETDHKDLYVLQLRLARRSTVGRLVISGFEHENYAPKSFDILLDGRVVKRVSNLRYRDNKAQVTLDPTLCRTVTLKIREYYGASPAIRELEVYPK